jgi:hypothetical protein
MTVRNKLRRELFSQGVVMLFRNYPVFCFVYLPAVLKEHPAPVLWASESIHQMSLHNHFGEEVEYITQSH